MQPDTQPGFWDSIKAFFTRLISLDSGLDREGTVFEIRNNCTMHGANAWMLMCSIMIASLGLDLNSPAVIIGAMLISPLMAPILGVGLGIGTSDYATLGISLRHFGIAIGIALFTSTLYFLITPLGTVTPEILARTEPTILDVAIAIFGGTAGIISASRKDKSNAIPGVAIATALMPPLCVSGYGIATGNITIALSSFYLFFLNSFFVALATYAIVRFLHFPFVRHEDGRGRKRRQLIIVASTIIMIVPSTFILLGVIRKVQETNRVDNFVRTHFADYMKYIDQWNYVRGDSVNTLVIKVYGSEIDATLYSDYQESLADFGIFNTNLEILPTSEIDLDKFEALEAQISGFEKVAQQLTETRKAQREREALVDSLLQTIDQIRGDTIPLHQVASELKVLFPDIASCAFARMQKFDFDTYNPRSPTLILEWPGNKSVSTRRRDEAKISAFIEERLKMPVEIVAR